MAFDIDLIIVIIGKRARCKNSWLLSETEYIIVGASQKQLAFGSRDITLFCWHEISKKQLAFDRDIYIIIFVGTCKLAGKQLTFDRDIMLAGTKQERK